MLIMMPAQLNWQSTRLVSGRLSVRFRRLAPLKNPNLRNFLPGVVVQQARTPACHAGGHGFEPRPSRHLIKDDSFCGPIVQWLGQETFNLLTRVRFPMGPPKKVILICWWVISSVGQSICLTSRGSQVRVLYHPVG